MRVSARLATRTQDKQEPSTWLSQALTPTPWRRQASAFVSGPRTFFSPQGFAQFFPTKVLAGSPDTTSRMSTMAAACSINTDTNRHRDTQAHHPDKHGQRDQLFQDSHTACTEAGNAPLTVTALHSNIARTRDPCTLTFQTQQRTCKDARFLATLPGFWHQESVKVSEHSRVPPKATVHHTDLSAGKSTREHGTNILPCRRSFRTYSMSTLIQLKVPATIRQQHTAPSACMTYHLLSTHKHP